MLSENDPVKMLRLCAEDPMWANHAEVSKSLLTRSADEIERLRTALAQAEAAQPVAPIIAARYRNSPTGRWTYTDHDIGSIEADGWREVTYLCDANAAPQPAEAAPKQKAAPDERAAFDAWFASFQDVSADFAWAAWQARAALAAPQPSTGKTP